MWGVKIFLISTLYTLHGGKDFSWKIPLFSILRASLSAYVAINEDDENIIVNTLRADQELPSVTVHTVRAEAREILDNDKKGEVNELKKNEDEDGEEGLAVLPVAGLLII